MRAMGLYGQERPVDISYQPRRRGERCNGAVSVKLPDQKSEIKVPVWINNPKLISKGMSWHTHRRVFDQLKQIELDIVEFRVFTPEGERVFTPVNHKSTLTEPKCRDC